MSAKDDAEYIFNLFTKESQRPVEPTDVTGRYRGYAIGQVATLWRKMTSEVTLDEDLEQAGLVLLTLLRLPHYMIPPQAGAVEGFAWARKVLEENFNTE